MPRMPSSSNVVEKYRELCEIHGIRKTRCDQKHSARENITDDRCNEIQILFQFIPMKMEYFRQII